MKDAAQRQHRLRLHDAGLPARAWQPDKVSGERVGAGWQGGVGARGHHTMSPSMWVASSSVTPLLFLHVTPTQNTQWCCGQCPLVISTWKSVGIVSLTTRPKQTLWCPPFQSFSFQSSPSFYQPWSVAVPSTHLPGARCWEPSGFFSDLTRASGSSTNKPHQTSPPHRLHLCHSLQATTFSCPEAENIA